MRKDVIDVAGKGTKKRYLCLSFFVLVLALCGCASNRVTDQTKDAVKQKKEQVLALYSDVEKKAKENNIAVDESFTNMKGQLTKMSQKIEEKMEDTTEEDAKRAMEELERLENNLKTAKKNVENHIAK